MGGSSVLSRLVSARTLFTLFVCLVCVLASAEVARAAAPEKISYTPPSGKSSSTRGGISSFVGTGSQAENVVLQFQDSQIVGSLDCTESEPCDSYDIYPAEDASEVAVAPCQNFGTESVYCPDAEDFTATLDEGTNDSYIIRAPLEYQKATVKAGNGGDFIEGTEPTEFGAFPDVDEFAGGAGNDRLIGGPGNDIIRGGPGEDVIDGHGGEDQLYGEGGNDQIIGGSSGKSLEAGGEGTNKLGVTFNFEAPDLDTYDGGDETFDGEGGTSIVSFFHAPGPVNIKVDGLPDSGVPGQQDTIEGNVSEVDGGENNDTLTAGTTPVTLDGEGGNDTIYGGPGGDTLRGGGGDDTIHTVGPAGVGPDSVYASEDFCDVEISCPVGNTTIYANDGILDQITCAPGADVVYADTIDVVSTAGVFNCTTVFRSAETGSGAGGSTPGGSAPGGGAGSPGGVTVGTPSFAHVKTKGDTASLVVACAGASTSACSETLTLSVVETLRSGKLIAVAAASKTKKKTVTIGHASVTLSGGQSKTVSVALNSTGRALLKREHKLHVKLLLTQTSAGKTVAVKGQTLAFTAPKHH
jgi:RTX calcium-binding nonapeptide repeat (4 copies)